MSIPANHKTALELAALAYCSDINNVAEAIKNHSTSEKIVWSSIDAVKGIALHITHNIENDNYHLIITVSKLLYSYEQFKNDLSQGQDIFKQVKWSYPSNPEATEEEVIDQRNTLKELKDQKTVKEYLKSQSILNITVTGHGIAGAFATIYAASLQNELQQEDKSFNISLVTSSEPILCNKDFPEQFDNDLTNVSRYYNIVDVVPYKVPNTSNTTSGNHSKVDELVSFDTVAKASVVDMTVLTPEKQSAQAEAQPASQN